MDNTLTQETIQRRPEYVEAREKALLDAIFGSQGESGFSGGLLQSEDLFKIAPYRLAGQMGRDPETGEITGLGAETFGSQYIMQDADQDGVPDFFNRYGDYFGTAKSALESGIGQLGEAEQYFSPAMSAVKSGQGMYNPADYISDYMNPYTENVLSAVEKDIERQGALARNRASADAISRGAFGGSRQAIQAAEVERNILDAKAKASADLRSKGYQSALAASSDAYKNAQTRDLEAGRLMGGLGQSVSQVGSQYGSLAGTTADIGRVYSALQPADIAFMSGVGEADRGYRQNMIDTARMEYQRPTEQAVLPYNYAYGALTGTPSAGVYSSSQQNYSPSTNPYLAGLGAYTTLQGINQA